MATGKTTVSYDGDTYNYYFQNDGSAYTMYIADGALYDGLGERVDAEDGNSYSLVTVPSDSVVRIKGSNNVIEGGSTLIVNTSGRVRRTGTVKIDGYRYTVNNYVVTDVEAVD